ncbi:LytTR family DNA-binding domain-containing protein [Ureibacillus sp. FSL K6-8385]|uniref:LytTR family transcriptional regulator n=1 Tax=Ureibacillus terrenus TaxID=118246 RepID=A0A540UV72_9BACL|nr:LytTR family DNA-binding domain-containing protein [Ureibacillus terrenus]MED3662070.1 LytTR family DNA-binding domain-containing protein [Ureibacillus terrenus]MED3765189.1 LytTR family DNA-binding domain-containing protein [Ureibacillus terrenus]TQE88390.1 LytTR family transcriptional regulator [Ureibacillus terrenus]
MEVAIVHSSKPAATKRGQTLFIPLVEILFIERINQCSCIISQHDSIPVRTTLKFFGSSLPDNFVRAHRSFIINKNLVKGLNRRDYNNFIVKFKETKAEALVSKGQLENLFTLNSIE